MIGLGLAGLVKRLSILGAVFITLSVAQVTSFSLGVDAYWVTSPVRFALMFVAGMLVYALSDRLPVTRGLVARS